MRDSGMTQPNPRTVVLRVPLSAAGVDGGEGPVWAAVMRSHAGQSLPKIVLTLWSFSMILGNLVLPAPASRSFEVHAPLSERALV